MATTKSVGSGNLSFVYETDAQKALLQQLASKLMTGGQIEYLITQKRLPEANQALLEADSLVAQLSQDAAYRSCCEPVNNGRLNPARNNLASKIRSAEQQAAQEQRNQAFSQNLQTMVTSSQSQIDAIRERSASYQPLMWQPQAGGSSLPLILGIVGGATVLLLLVVLLARR